jgi:hypothetical protein
MSRRSPHGQVPAWVDAERDGWYQLTRLVRSLNPAERLVLGYYVSPPWSVRDLMGHVGTWLAEAEVQLERIRGGTYEGHDIDVDALNAVFLDAMRGQPWEVVWIQANAGRTRMLQALAGLGEPDLEAAWWIRKSGGDHYAEHLARLREWVRELRRRRPAATGEPGEPGAPEGELA